MSNCINEKLSERTTGKTPRYSADCEYPISSANPALADAVLSRLPERPSVLDVGCGTGELSMALAPQCESLIGVDTSRSALRSFHRRAVGAGLFNIGLVEGNFQNLEFPGYFPDAVVFRTVGCISWLEHTVCRSAGKVFYISSEEGTRCFPAGGKKRGYICSADIRPFLSDNGLKFEEAHIVTSFARPLERYDDAFAFLSGYDPISAPEELRRTFDERLAETGREDYPFFLRVTKEYRLVTFEWPG